MTYPDNIIYSKDHIWLKPNGDSYILGITDFAQDLLGDIVYVEINKNSEFKKNQGLGSIESVKTASDIIAPENGKIILINPEIETTPEKINENPFKIWICQVEFISEVEENDFLSKDKYLDLIKT
ncbi:glycine cleavage system protein H [Methylophilaceae bacterium]|jgi:glycine cleavage system H protein|nr:glycine cleavage system protein H [Methylophilaceae bacterium]